jgi:hypothetical protein
MAIDRKGLIAASKEGYARIDRGRTRATQNVARRRRDAPRHLGGKQKQPVWKTIFLAAQDVGRRGGESVAAVAMGR